MCDNDIKNFIWSKASMQRFKEFPQKNKELCVQTYAMDGWNG